MYVTTTDLYESTKTQIHFSSPTSNADLAKKLYNDKDKLDAIPTPNLGYGYIGINAKYVPDILIRRAIMYAMDTSLCEDYYGGSNYVELIYRPMSKTLKDYYPENVTATYPYEDNEDGAMSLQLAQEAGYNDVDKNGKLINAKGERLKYTFTIAGESTDHPAFQILNNAERVLNDIGFDITVVTSSTALSKLASGQLAVWAAAWSSSSDPDMYQVYHKDSSATSINSWGYPYLLSAQNKGPEKAMIEELSELIEEGRETNVISERKKIYSDALDKVMDLAIELPTYQRKNIYVFRKNFFDEDTLALMHQATAFQSPLSKIWLVGYNEG